MSTKKKLSLGMATFEECITFYDKKSPDKANADVIAKLDYYTKKIHTLEFEINDLDYQISGIEKSTLPEHIEQTAGFREDKEYKILELEVMKERYNILRNWWLKNSVETLQILRLKSELKDLDRLKKNYATKEQITVSFAGSDSVLFVPDYIKFIDYIDGEITDKKAELIKLEAIVAER